MLSNNDIVRLFFTDLKKYNATNFKTIANANLLESDNPTVYKAFSSAVTRYFIFKERHPEISEVQHNILYFHLKLDLVARYFSDYPDNTIDNLVGFQLELKNYIKEMKDKEVSEHVQLTTSA